MAKNKNEGILALAAEIEDFSGSIAKNMATKSRDDLYNTADDAIRSFYDHYTPKYYERHTIPHYGHNINKSIKKYYHAPHKNIYSGGIELSPQSMEDLYKTDPDYIFNLIMAGFHGNIPMLPPYEKSGQYHTRYIPPVMDPGPLNLILDERDRLILNASKNAGDIATKIKRKKAYKFIS